MGFFSLIKEAHDEVLDKLFRSEMVLALFFFGLPIWLYLMFLAGFIALAIVPWLVFNMVRALMPVNRYRFLGYLLIFTALALFIGAMPASLRACQYEDTCETIRTGAYATGLFDASYESLVALHADGTPISANPTLNLAWLAAACILAVLGVILCFFRVRRTFNKPRSDWFAWFRMDELYPVAPIAFGIAIGCLSAYEFLGLPKFTLRDYYAAQSENLSNVSNYPTIRSDLHAMRPLRDGMVRIDSDSESNKILVNREGFLAMKGQSWKLTLKIDAVPKGFAPRFWTSYSRGCYGTGGVPRNVEGGFELTVLLSCKKLGEYDRPGDDISVTEFVVCPIVKAPNPYFYTYPIFSPPHTAVPRCMFPIAPSRISIVPGI